MKRLFSFSLAVMICFCLLVGSERRAWAYINPGDGLLALQSAASVVAAGLYFLRRKILGLFTRKPSAPRAETKTIVLPVATKTENRNAA